MNRLDKQIEGMRWEYLMRSEKYKDYCLKQRVEKTMQMSHIKLEDKKSGKLMIYYTPPLTENPIEEIFLKYGDVHARTFKDYWEEKENLNRRTDVYFGELVKDYTDIITYDLEDIVYWHKQSYGREPSASEIEIIFPNHLKIKNSNTIYLKILQKDFSSDEVKKIIGRVKALLNNRIPIKRFHKGEIERYLKVYDRRNQKTPVTFKKIQQELYPKIDFTENTKRSRMNDFKRAKEIIANVENNKLFYW